MAESESSESENDSQASVSEYQVFLSFRGPDCRQGLADVLYHDMITAGIRTFRDDDELEDGDKITNILPAIGNSRICVPIFSRAFAQSRWCLSEVERMVNLEKKIMPIFYKVTPDDVKLKSGLFKEDLEKHVEKCGTEQVKKWEDALRAVPEIKGREVLNMGYAEFSKKFVKTLLNKLEVKMKFVTESLVKRHYQMEALMEFLDVGADYIRLVVGIHGLGGIGKTTLATVVFNQLLARFDCHSFLENIPVRPNSMQKQLLEDLNPKLKDFQGTNLVMMLKQNFHNRKVLIVLDDVSKKKQVQMILRMLDCFGSGSRIILTTRDIRVFTKEVLRFEVKDMNKDEALQLFSRHAFAADSPPSDFRVLSKEVIGLTGRLPLALEVIGSLLHGCEKNDWEAQIDKLKKIPNPDIVETLRVSFDALDYEQQQIFLDIACFFINKETSGAIYMWEACNFCPSEGIKVLSSMSLVVITSEDKFWMHDMIRDLGRELVRLECINNAAKRSRIWSQREAWEALRVKKGEKEVRGLFLEELYDGDLTYKEFSRFGELRLLKLVGTKLAGDFEPIFPKLKWFTWHQCPVDLAPSNLSLGELVVLDLSRSRITETWAGWNLIQTAKYLKVLDLTDCFDLKSIPDLSSNEALERLILSGCRRLAEIHISVTKLKRLRHLNLNGCDYLKGLPEAFGSMALQWFSWHRCPSNFALTNVCLRELVVLDLSHSFITESWAGWSSIETAKNLKVLDLTGCHNLKSTPDLSNNETLERLILRGCRNLVEIHSSIGKLKRLSHLDLKGCPCLRGIPQELGLPENLENILFEGIDRNSQKKEPAQRVDDLEASASEYVDDLEASASEYDVFLCFRGADSRQGLADVLYRDMTAKGIFAFRGSDDLDIVNDELRTRKILQCIRNSKICIPIFSETFADSARCLHELEAMVELEKQIMPIFYTCTREDVEPNTGLFMNYLRKHKKKHGTEQVKKWVEALKVVTKIRGREVKHTGLAEFSHSFVMTLLIKLKAKMKYVINYLVKRNDEEEALIKLLDIGADDVRIVGVHGMGGLGKTTLAKIVFNRLFSGFDCCSFLENAQESLIRNGSEHLQRQLLVDLDPKFKHFQAINAVVLLRRNFRDRKVLIVLDDVNERKHVEMIVSVLDSFGSGSRIIITTRDKRALTEEARDFEVQEMNRDEALQLFSRHAFGEDSPPIDYHMLSNEVVGLTGCFPLAINVIGSLLQGREKNDWKAQIRRLKKIPNQDVQEKLKISFEALEDEYKQIFLDIACFFVDQETSRAIYMWEACGFFPDEGIEALVSLSLLKIKGNIFAMNDLIRDCGRDLVREECAEEPANRSRIWSRTEAFEVLKMKSKGKENVESLCRGTS